MKTIKLNLKDDKFDCSACNKSVHKDKLTIYTNRNGDDIFICYDCFVNEYFPFLKDENEKDI